MQLNVRLLRNGIKDLQFFDDYIETPHTVRARLPDFTLLESKSKDVFYLFHQSLDARSIMNIDGFPIAEPGLF